MPRKEIIKEATALARTIQAEMQFPVLLRPSDKARLTHRLHDEVPEKNELSFQQNAGETTPKVQLGKDLVIEDRMLKLFFCIFHNEFVLDTGTDIDHVFAFDKIRRKQIKLLEFLNTNRDFADAFLAQPGIDEFFRRDVDGRIKGTSYFFKLCYNDIGNLLLMCHACNIKKSTADPLEWFRQQETYFGEKFVEAVMDAGGLQDGVILPKIYQPDTRDVTISISEADISLHLGDSQGLGEFALKWFLNHFQSVYDMHSNFYVNYYEQFKEALDEMRQLIIEGNIKGAHERHETLSRMLNGYSAVYTALIEREKERESDTESDGSTDAKRRKQISTTMLSDGDLVTHEIKKIKRFLAQYYPKETVEVLCDGCSKFQEERIILSDQWREIFGELDNYIFESKSSGQMPTTEAIGAVIIKLCRNKAYAVEEEKRHREVAERRADEAERLMVEETHRREAAERRAEEEAQNREAAERRAAEEAKRNAKLMARLNRYEIYQPGFFSESEKSVEQKKRKRRLAAPKDNNPEKPKRAKGADESYKPK